MISSKAILAALKWVVLWSVVAFFVGLLTLIFSFLGAIFCAALAGMMSGATRHSRWPTIPLAAMFPCVLWLVLRLSKAELPAHQIHVLMVVCFATFWVTFALGWGVVAYERKDRSPQAEPGGANPSSKPLAPSCPAVALPASRRVGSSPAGLTLRQLQGKWLHQAAGLSAPQQKELMEIEDTHLTLSAIGPDGQVQSSVQGELRLESASPFHCLVVSAGTAEWPADLSVCI